MQRGQTIFVRVLARGGVNVDKYYYYYRAIILGYTYDSPTPASCYARVIYVIIFYTATFTRHLQLNDTELCAHTQEKRRQRPDCPPPHHTVGFTATFESWKNLSKRFRVRFRETTCVRT